MKFHCTVRMFSGKLNVDADPEAAAAAAEAAAAARISKADADATAMVAQIKAATEALMASAAEAMKEHAPAAKVCNRAYVYACLTCPLF